MKIKKMILGVWLTLAVSCVFCSCQSSEELTENSDDSELPELKIGVDILKPFFYINENGNCEGIDAEIAEEACYRAGYEPDFTEVSWSDRDDYLQDGKVDCLWSAFIKNGREDLYQWTDTYMQSNLRVLVDKKSPDKDLSTLKGHGGMAVRAGSRIEDVLLDAASGFPRVQIYSCGTFEMAETAFIKGFSGALGGHEAVLQQIINNYPGLYRFLDGTLMTADLGVAFAKDDTSEHLEKINDAINTMKTDGTIENILDKYGVNASTTEEVPENAEK